MGRRAAASSSLVRHVTSRAPPRLPHTRYFVGELEERHLKRLKERIVVLRQKKCLTDEEKNELEWSITAQGCLEQGAVNHEQVKRLSVWRTLSVEKRLIHVQGAKASIRTANEAFRLYADAAKRPDRVQKIDPPEKPNHELPVEQPQREETDVGHKMEIRPGYAAASLSRMLRQYRLPSWSSLWGEVKSENAGLSLPNFFVRRDKLFFHIAQNTLRFVQKAPAEHHDLFDAATRVVRMENIIGYKFKDKVLCLQALQRNENSPPLYWDGSVTPLVYNQRLALLGDRVLGAAMCDLWWQTKLRPTTHNRLRTMLESRYYLGDKGKKLGMGRAILSRRHPDDDDIAETFEAILGAVYLDSNESMVPVKEALEYTGIEQDLHEYGKKMEAPPQLKDEVETPRDKSTEVKEGVRTTENTPVGIRITIGSSMRSFFSRPLVWWQSLITRPIYLTQPAHTIRADDKTPEATSPAEQQSEDASTALPSPNERPSKHPITEVPSSGVTTKTSSLERTRHIGPKPKSGQVRLSETVILPAPELSMRTSTSKVAEPPREESNTESHTTTTVQQSTVAETAHIETDIPATESLIQPQATVKSNDVSPEDSIQRPWTVVELFEKMFGLERAFFMSHWTEETAASLRTKLEPLLFAMEEFGATRADYKAFKSHKIGHDTAVQSRYQELQQTLSLMEKELASGGRSRSRYNHISKICLSTSARLRSMEQKAPTSRNFTAFENWALKEGIPMYEVLELRAQAASRSCTSEDTLRDALAKYEELRSEKNRKVELWKTRAEPHLQFEIYRLIVEQNDIKSSFPSFRHHHTRSAWERALSHASELAPRSAEGETEGEGQVKQAQAGSIDNFTFEQSKEGDSTSKRSETEKEKGGEQEVMRVEDFREHKTKQHWDDEEKRKLEDENSWEPEAEETEREWKQQWTSPVQEGDSEEMDVGTERPTIQSKSQFKRAMKSEAARAKPRIRVMKATLKYLKAQGFILPEATTYSWDEPYRKYRARMGSPIDGQPTRVSPFSHIVNLELDAPREAVRQEEEDKFDLSLAASRLAILEKPKRQKIERKEQSENSAMDGLTYGQEGQVEELEGSHSKRTHDSVPEEKPALTENANADDGLVQGQERQVDVLEESHPVPTDGSIPVLDAKSTPTEGVNNEDGSHIGIRFAGRQIRLRSHVAFRRSKWSRMRPNMIPSKIPSKYKRTKTFTPAGMKSENDVKATDGNEEAGPFQPMAKPKEEAPPTAAEPVSRSRKTISAKGWEPPVEETLRDLGNGQSSRGKKTKQDASSEKGSKDRSSWGWDSR